MALVSFRTDQPSVATTNLRSERQHDETGCDATVAVFVDWDGGVDSSWAAGCNRIPSDREQSLREVVGKKRILLNDDQRRRLAVKGKILGLARLRGISDTFTPETILRWHRQLVARKWDHSDKRKPAAGRPAVDPVIVDLVLKFARENPAWGYDRIQGALANIGHTVSDQTVGNILKANGIEPAPQRKRQTTWDTFLKAHWDSVAAIDFTTTEIWTLQGLVTVFILVVMNLRTRRIEIAGVTAHPDSAWDANSRMSRMASC